MFKKATIANIKIRLALSGAAGSGKTYSALALGSHLGKIAVIDTERGSASRYANLFTYDVCELNQFHPLKYVDAIKAAEEAGYEVIIIDSLTHAWFFELAMAESAKNSFAAWKDIRPIERQLLDALAGSKCHVIATMRSKVEYDMTQPCKNRKS